MKKLGIALLLLLLCVSGIYFFLFQETQGEQLQAADCLPEDVLFYGEQIDFTDMYQTFVNSRMGRTLADIDFTAIGVEMGPAGDSLVEAEKSWEEVRDIVNSKAFNELFGREFSIAVFNGNSFSASAPAESLEERLLLIARPRHNVTILQYLSQFVSRDIPQSTVQYGEHTITRYQLDDNRTVSTANVEGLILAGFEERFVRKSLDYYDSGENVLSNNQEYKRLRENFSGAKIFSYLSLPAVLDQGRQIGKELPEDDRDEYFALPEQWEGWGAAAYGAWYDSGVMRDRTEILFDKAKLDSRVARLCDVKPGFNKTLELVPDEILFYYWTNTLNLPLMWEIYSAEATHQHPEALNILRHELRDIAGVELEDVLAMVGNEFSVIVGDVGGEGLPIPKAAMVVQLKNPKEFLRVFTILLSNADIPVNTKSYKEKELSYWGVAPQGGLQPAFTLIGNYLFVSNSLELVKQIVDTSDDPARSLPVSSAMKSAGKGLLEDNNSATYVHIAKLADAMEGLVTWAGAMAVLQGPEIARNSDIVVNKLALPLLDGMAMYAQLWSRSVITEDSIVLESTTTTVP